MRMRGVRAYETWKILTCVDSAVSSQPTVATFSVTRTCVFLVKQK